MIPGRDPVELPTTSRRALEGAGLTIIEEGQPSFLLDHSVLITGEVDRTSGFEPGFPPQQALRDGQVYAVLGGFHLGGPLFEPLIPQVREELERLSPAVIVPAHCTGRAAQRVFADRFPAAVIPNTVGTRFEL